MPLTLTTFRLLHRSVELIGGFVFRMDDVLIDASVAAQLKLLRRKLGCKPNRIV